MCGRIIRKTERQLIVQDLGMDDEGGPDDHPHYNISPGRPVLAIRTNANGGREVGHLRWGLIPSWAKDAKVGWKMINARAETLSESRRFEMRSESDGA